VPYAAEESPSEDSTPSASGLDSRSLLSCSVASGGPSSLRLAEYQAPSGTAVFMVSVHWTRVVRGRAEGMGPSALS